MPDAGVLTDAQSAEIFDSMTAFSDFEAIFGRESLQCAFRYYINIAKVNIEGPLPAAEVLWRDLVVVRVNYIHHLGSGSDEEQGSKSTRQSSSLQQLCGQT